MASRYGDLTSQEEPSLGADGTEEDVGSGVHEAGFGSSWETLHHPQYLSDTSFGCQLVAPQR